VCVVVFRSSEESSNVYGESFNNDGTETSVYDDKSNSSQTNKLWAAAAAANGGGGGGCCGGGDNRSVITTDKSTRGEYD